MTYLKWIISPIKVITNLHNTFQLMVFTVLIFSVNTYAIEKKYPVDNAMGSSISFVTGGNILMRDSGGTGWSMYTSQGVNQVALYLTKNDAFMLKSIAQKSKLLSQELMSDGCDDYEVDEKIGTIQGRSQEFGTNKVSIYVKCKQGKVSLSLFYSDVHIVNTVHLSNRTWEELDKVANDILDLYFTHTKNAPDDINSFFNGQHSYVEWEHRWDLSDEENIKCLVESKSKSLNSKTSFKFLISDDKNISVNFYKAWNNNIQIDFVEIDLGDTKLRSNKSSTSAKSSTFTFKNEHITSVYDHINKFKKISLNIGISPNKIKTFELLDPLGHKSFPLSYSAKLYCDRLKESSGSWGFMFVDAIQNNELNKFIKSSSNYDKAGVVVMSVNPTKKAFSSGLRLFDVVLGINGEATNFRHFMNYMGVITSHKNTVLSVLREDKFIQVTM